MKFQSSIATFSLMISLTANVQARDIILVQNLATSNEGAALIKILQKKFNIPRKIIHYMEVQTCDKNSDAIMQLCLKQNGEMEILKMNRYVMTQTMGVFLEAEEL